MFPSLKRILCVDDDGDSCEIISLMLHNANENYRVTTVGSGNTALESYRGRDF